MQMITRTLILLLLTGFFTAQAAECTYPAKPINWILRYCAMVVGTDDETEIQKSDCFKSAGRDANTTDECRMKERYKTMICEQFMMDASHHSKLEDCLKDDEIKPFISG